MRIGITSSDNPDDLDDSINDLTDELSQEEINVGFP
jgi:hypothetical protein